jgi:hypothetical protein
LQTNGYSTPPEVTKKNKRHVQKDDLEAEDGQSETEAEEKENLEQINDS